MGRASDLVVVKLGGSYAFSAPLRLWLHALAGCAGRIVVVPGGGPFADVVREAQPKMGFDDRAAHHMALLAMTQYGRAMAGLHEGFALVESAADILRVVAARQVPVWSPVPMALESRDLPESWEVTADSLAAWLARRLGARSVLLVKQIRPPGDLAPAAELVARGVVDPVLPRLLGAGGPEAYVVGPMDHAAAAAAIRERTVLGTRVAPG